MADERDFVRMESTRPAPLLNGPAAEPSSSRREKVFGPASAPSEATLLYGRFEVLSQLGEGSFGRVLRCFDREEGLEVALKQSRQLGAEALLDFKREFRALTDVHHENLVRLFELFEANDAPWAFSMELVPGVQFLEWVRGPTQAADFDEQRLRGALPQIVWGLQALHGLGLLHRDLKPDNIRVTSEGRVVLLDFGLSSLAPAGHGHQEISGGTVAYMAPEQTDSRHGAPVDLYALGATLYEALTGSLPFQGGGLVVLMRKAKEPAPSPRLLCPAIPEDLEQLCLALLVADPARRATAQEVLDRLGSKPEVTSQPQLGSRHNRSAFHDFVGRAPELCALDAVYERARDEGLRVALIEGTSGIGKTALMEAWRRRQQSKQPDLLVLEGRCHAAEQLRFKMWDGLIDRLCEYLATLAPTQLRTVLPPECARLAALFPVLRRLPGISFRAARIDADPVAERFAAFCALTELLRRVATLRPLVLCLDDLQWGDEDSLALLQVLGASDDKPKLLLLATTRPLPEMAPRLRSALTRLMVQQSHFERLPVAPLSADECATLTARLMGRAENDLAVQEVARQTGGHPWFAAEMARLVGSDEATLDRSGLDGALRERAHKLGERPRLVLELLAAAGGPVRPAVLHPALALPSEQLSEAVSLLRAHRLVRSEGGGRVACYHDRVREAVLSALSEAHVQRLNARLAEASEQQEGDALVISGYWSAAGEPGRAMPWLIRAVEAAEVAGAYASATHLYEQMIAYLATQVSSAPELRELRELRLKRAEALASAGHCADSAQLLLELLEDCGGEERSRLQVRAAERLLQAGQVAAGLDVARRAFETLGMAWPVTPKAALRHERWHRLLLQLRGLTPRVSGPPDARDRARLQALAQLAHPLTWIDSARASELCARYLRLSLKAGQRGHTLRALVCQALMATDGYAPLLQRAQEFVDPEQPAELTAFWHFACGWHAWPENNLASAFRDLERSEALYRSAAPRAAWARANVQAALAMQKLAARPDRAWAAEVEQGLGEAELRGDHFGASLLSVGAAGALRHLMVDKPQRTVAEIRRVMGTWDSGQSVSSQAGNALGYTAWALLYTGGETALEELRRHLGDYAESQLLPVLQVISALALVCAAASSGHVSRYGAELRPLQGALGKLERADAALALAQIWWLDGKRDRALRSARSAHRGLEQAGIQGRAASVLLAFLESAERGRAEGAEQERWFAELGWVNPRRAMAMLLPLYPLLVG